MNDPLVLQAKEVRAVQKAFFQARRRGPASAELEAMRRAEQKLARLLARPVPTTAPPIVAHIADCARAMIAKQEAWSQARGALARYWHGPLDATEERRLQAAELKARGDAMAAEHTLDSALATYDQPELFLWGSPCAR